MVPCGREHRSKGVLGFGAAMSEGCPFCALCSSSDQGLLIYADESVAAFPDRRPINPGHLLVVPRTHVDSLWRLPNELYSQVMDVAKRLAIAVDGAFHPVRVGLIVAGFDVPHAHVHLVPMREYHDITSKPLLEGKRSILGIEELRAVTERVRKQLQDAPEPA